ncbi:hypothetical protein MHU86_25413 [Fragilaria crotonensis]|nr:hypothetical protein MHU86_25413 [Fragilaria crotonensis]
MVAKYDAECRQIRLSGTVEPRRRALGDTVVSPFCSLGLVIASASMLLNSPDLSLLQLANIDVQLSTIDIDTELLQQKVLAPLASARESIMGSHTFEFQPTEEAQGALAVAKDGILAAIGGIKMSLAVSMQTAQVLVRNTVGELQTALQNANQALLLATRESQSAFTDTKEMPSLPSSRKHKNVRLNAAKVVLPTVDPDSIVQQFNTAQDILLAKVKEVQDLARLNAAKVVLPTVDTDSVVQQFNTAQDILLSKVKEVQDLARLSADKVVLPTVDTDSVVQQFNSAQDAILSKMNEAQELARLSADKVVLPTVDTDSVVQQSNTAQGAILSKMNEAQELARLSADKVVLPTVDTDSVVLQFNTAQDVLLSKVNEAQELARINAGKVVLPTVDTDSVVQQFNTAQDTILSKINEAQQLARINAGKVVLPTVDTDSFVQQFNTAQDAILSKMNEAQELARINAAKVELPNVDTDVVRQQVNDVQSSVLSRANEIKEAALAQASSVKLSLPTPVDTLALRQQVNDFYGIHSSNILTKAMEGTQEQLVRINAAVGGDGVAQQPLPPLSNTEALLLKIGVGPEVTDAVTNNAKVATKIIMPKYVF